MAASTAMLNVSAVPIANPLGPQSPPAWTCLIDGLQFPSVSLLSDHFKTVHKPNPYNVEYQCPYDGKKFLNDEAAFIAHMNSHTLKTLIIDLDFPSRAMSFALPFSSIKASGQVPELANYDGMWVQAYQAVIAYHWHGNIADLPISDVVAPRGSFALDMWSKFVVPPEGSDPRPDQRNVCWYVPYPTIQDGSKNDFDLFMFLGYNAPPPNQQPTWIILVNKYVRHVGGSFDPGFLADTRLALTHVSMTVTITIP